MYHGPVQRAYCDSSLTVGLCVAFEADATYGTKAVPTQTASIDSKPCKGIVVQKLSSTWCLVQTGGPTADLWTGLTDAAPYYAGDDGALVSSGDQMVGTARGDQAMDLQLDASGGGSGSAGTAKVSANDTTAGYLNGKLVAGTGVTLTEGSDGANETLTVAGSAASATAQGIVELATSSEVTTGTDTTRVLTPEALAQSNYGLREVTIQVCDKDTSPAVGDNKEIVMTPRCLDGWNVVGGAARVYTTGAGSTLLTVQVHRRRGATDADIFSTRITVDASEYSSATAATQPVVNTANDDLASNSTNGIDLLCVDVDAIPETTAPKGLWVDLWFRKG